MTNIAEQKAKVRELVKVSSLCKLMGKQESLLDQIDHLPDEASEDDLKILQGIRSVVESSEADPEMKETLDLFLRLDEIYARRSKNPDAPIEDLLG